MDEFGKRNSANFTRSGTRYSNPSPEKPFFDPDSPRIMTKEEFCLKAMVVVRSCHDNDPDLKFEAAETDNNRSYITVQDNDPDATPETVEESAKKRMLDIIQRSHRGDLGAQNYLEHITGIINEKDGYELATAITLRMENATTRFMTKEELNSRIFEVICITVEYHDPRRH